MVVKGRWAILSDAEGGAISDIGGVSSSLVANVCRLLKLSKVGYGGAMFVLNAQFGCPMKLVSVALVA